MNIERIMASLEAKHPGESEYLQAVKEVLLSIEDVYNQHPEFEKAKIIERLVEPDRIFTFRVTWVDDKGEVQTNLGYRVQFNNAIADVQERFDHAPDGRRQRRFGLLAPWQEQCRNHAFLPGVHAGAVASSGSRYGRACR